MKIKSSKSYSSQMHYITKLLLSMAPCMTTCFVILKVKKKRMSFPLTHDPFLIPID